MKTGIRSVLILLIVGGVALVVFRKLQSESPQSTANTQLTIAVIPKGTTHSYWNFVHAGADRAASDCGVKIIFRGPVLEDDRAAQISLVEQFASGDADGIVLAPLDDTALLPSVQSAMQKKPVIIIDSSLEGQVGKDFVCYVGTDNTAAGKIGGTELARLLGGKGKYVLLRSAVGSASTQQREDGFLSAMQENPGMVSLLAKEVYGGATVDQAQKACLNMFSQIRQANGIFCSNESTTQGMLNTLEQNNLAGKIHFVGFDTTPELIEALKKGEIDALVSQNPTKMGYQGVKACVDYIHGVAQQPIRDSGALLITRDNLNTPEVQKLLDGG